MQPQTGPGCPHKPSKSIHKENDKLLKEIRSREQEHKQALVKASQKAEKRLESARREADRIRSAAAQEGAAEGQAQAEALLARTDMEIQQAEEQLQTWAEELGQRYEETHARLLNMVLDRVLGHGRKGGHDGG